MNPPDAPRRGPFGRLLDVLAVPRRVDAQAPLARALVDHARTGRSRSVHVLRPGGASYSLETDDFFDTQGHQSQIDQAVLAHARGRVLDVGAGAGRHALALEACGCEVVAIDVSPMCVDLMRTRGVHRTHCIDVWDLLPGAEDAQPGGAGLPPEARALRGQRYDTILFGMQSIGIVGTLGGLDAMLAGLPALLAPGGQVLLDSSPPRGHDFEALFTFADGEGDEKGEGGGSGTVAPQSVDADADVPDARRAGEAEVSFSYRGWRGVFFPWLYLGADALAHAAARRGFACRVLAQADGSGEYLACLEPARGAGVYDRGEASQTGAAVGAVGAGEERG